MSRSTRILVLSLLLVVTCASAALADDLFPPPWRGIDGTTFAGWEFNTPDPNPLPDYGYLPYGLPEMTVTPALGAGWLPEANGRIGVWPLSGSINVLLYNRPEPLPYKDIWIQLTWCGCPPSVIETTTQTQAELVQAISLPDGWTHGIYTIRIRPNPPFERVLIAGSPLVDELVIDTACVPEPSSLIVLSGALSGLAGFAWRRRR